MIPFVCGCKVSPISSRLPNSRTCAATPCSVGFALLACGGAHTLDHLSLKLAGTEICSGELAKDCSTYVIVSPW